MITKQLKPCPFCGADDPFVHPSRHGLDEYNLYFACCRKCGARGSEDGSRGGAAMSWNTRIAHSLKILPEHFNAVENGNKNAEIRYNDRNYRVGDILSLREWDGDYSGRHIEVRVTHILDDEKYLQNGYVMLSFEVIEVKS